MEMSKLIDKLKARYPELEKEPLVDELEALLSDEEDMEDDMMEEAPMDMEMEDIDMEDEEEEDEEEMY